MYKKTVFRNGLRLIETPIKSTRTVTILIATGVGSSYEEKKTNGISHFIEHMFFKGTKKRPNPIKLLEEVDKIGGVKNAFTGKEITGYWIKVEKSYFDLALDWISDIFLNSQIPTEELEKEKGVILQEINMYLDNPSLYIDDLWEETLYGDQPAGWMISGSKENVKRFKRKDLLNYIKTHYSAQNTVISIAGNIKGSVKKKVEKIFKKARKANPPKRKKTIEEQFSPKVKTLSKKTDQSHLAIGVRSYSMFHPQRFVQQIIANLLGGFMSSRIFSEVREKRGLAYSVKTESEAYQDRGYIVTFAEVSHKNVERTVKIILNEYKKLKERKVGRKELRKVKDNFKGRLSLSLESSNALSSFYGTQELILGKILTPDDIMKEVEKITSDDIQKMARDIFQPSKLNLALIGPFKENKIKNILEI